MSLKRFTVTLLGAFLVSASLFAQEATKVDDLRARVEQLEKRIAEMQQNGSTPELEELKRQIEVLTREIESAPRPANRGRRTALVAAMLVIVSTAVMTEAPLSPNVKAFRRCRRHSPPDRKCFFRPESTGR